MRPLSLPTLIALIASVAAAAVLFVAGGYVLVATARPLLFALALLAIGAITGALSIAAFRGHRPSWSYLIATWAVVGFCAFFTAPKVMHLPKVQQVTVALEEELGRRKAEAFVDSENFKARSIALGACTGMALPFVAMCVAFAIGRRDYG